MDASSTVGKEFVNAATTLHSYVTATSTSSSKAPAHSSIARTLTRFLFSEIDVPSILYHDYSNLLPAFTNGVAVGSSLWYFFRRNQNRRDRIQFAMFHLLRLCDNMSPEDSRRFRADPHLAIAEMQEEVIRMTTSHITQAEGEAVINLYRRKVWGEFEAEVVESRVRRKMGDAAVVNLEEARQKLERLDALRSSLRDASSKNTPQIKSASHPNALQPVMRLKKKHQTNKLGIGSLSQRNTPAKGHRRGRHSLSSSLKSAGAYSSPSSDDEYPPGPAYLPVSKAPKVRSAEPAVVLPQSSVHGRSGVRETTRPRSQPRSVTQEVEYEGVEKPSQPQSREPTFFDPDSEGEVSEEGRIADARALRIAQLELEIKKSKRDVKNMEGSQSHHSSPSAASSAGVRKLSSRPASASPGFPISPVAPSLGPPSSPRPTEIRKTPATAKGRAVKTGPTKTPTAASVTAATPATRRSTRIKTTTKRYGK